MNILKTRGIIKLSREDFIVITWFTLNIFTHISYAIEREREIKKWRREKKDALIASLNPNWTFLNDEVNQ